VAHFDFRCIAYWYIGKTACVQAILSLFTKSISVARKNNDKKEDDGEGKRRRERIWYTQGHKNKNMALLAEIYREQRQDE
jgi:hypothetical protein